MKIKQLKTLINEEIRKIPEIPLSLLLSGGIDSSLILAFLRMAYPDLPIATFTLAGTDKHPDLINARRIAKLFKTIHAEIIPSDKDIENFSNMFDKIKKSDSKGCLNWFILFNYARLFSNIIVTGDGADECFGGYWLHQYPLGHKETGDINSFEEICPRPKKHLENMIESGFRDFLFKDKSNEGDFNAIWEYYVSRLYPDHIEIMSYIADHFGLTIYSPFCSDELISFMRGLSYTDRINKKLERELALEYLPESIIYREKLALNIALNYDEPGTD